MANVGPIPFGAEAPLPLMQSNASRPGMMVLVAFIFADHREQEMSNKKECGFMRLPAPL